MNKLPVLILLLFAWSTKAMDFKALKGDTIPKIDFDTSYIKNFHDQLVLKTYIVSKSNDFSITDVSNDVTTEFRPNDVANLGFGVNYKAFGLAVAFIPLGNRNNDKYGRTQKLDLQGNMYTRKFGFDLRFQYYKGFYVDNAYSLNPDFGQDSIIPVRSDIRTVSFGANVFYIFNSQQFSFKNTFTHNEWQKKPAGSFFAGSSFSGFRITADSAIGPNSIIDTIDVSDYFKSVDVISVGGFGGYAYTYVLAKQFFATAALAPGLATVFLNSKNGAGEEVANDSRLSFQLNFRMGIGYNSEKFFGGISGFWDYSQIPYGNREGRIDYTSGAIRFYFGMRFL